MAGGYAGRLLRVDLGRLQASPEAPGEALLRDFIGGEGLAAKYLYDEVPAGADPLGPENRLIFMTGPLTGSLAPASGRHCVVTKSPLTGCETSAHAGGFWGTLLKLAGLDGIIVSGRSERPVYLFIDDGNVQFLDAAGLWGRDVFQTDALIKEELSDRKVSVASIGPAGENLVPFASIQSDRQRSAARGGPGAVMGSKRLKAIAVRGTRSFRAARPADCFATMNQLLERCRDNALAGDLFPKYGTAGLIGPVNEHHALPARNYRERSFPGAGAVSGQRLAETVLKRTRGCYCCTIHCTRLVDIPLGPYQGTRGKGPDYDSVAALGPGCGVDDLEAVCRANLWCDQYGLDTVSTGEAIAWAMELFERGLLTPEDTRGIELRSGNGEAMAAMIPKIATRMEFGAVLAGGLREAARQIGKGSEKYLMDVKNMGLPGLDPRGSKAMGLHYATDNRGGDDARSFATLAECLGFRSAELGMPERFDPLGEAGKAAWLVPVQNYFAAVNSLVCCLFTVVGYAVEPGLYAQHLAAVTGFDYDREKLLLAGERTWNLQRAFNAREGFGRKEDALPERLASGPDAVRLGPMLDEYYRSRGWDPATGWPTAEKLQALGLAQAAADLEKAKGQAPAAAA